MLLLLLLLLLIMMMSVLVVKCACALRPRRRTAPSSEPSTQHLGLSAGEYNHTFHTVLACALLVFHLKWVTSHCVAILAYLLRPRLRAKFFNQEVCNYAKGKFLDNGKIGVNKKCLLSSPTPPSPISISASRPEQSEMNWGTSAVQLHTFYTPIFFAANYWI